MVRCYSLDRNKLENESELEYIHRICTIKSELGMTWKEIAELFKDNLGIYYSPSYYSKNFKAGNFDTPVASVTSTATLESNCDGFCEGCEELPECLSEWSDDLSKKDTYIKEQLHKLALKKIEVSDIVTQNNAYIRRLSREQTIKDIAHDYANIMSEKKILDAPWLGDWSNSSDVEGALLLSDWHYGMVCDNPWNKFDPDICKERVNKLLSKTIQIIKKNNVSHLHVLDLADLIAGRIHTQIRIESRFDVITQTMQVAEILAEFLNDLSYHCSISFYSCLDNHSRLEPNKKESMDLESLARLIPWYLTERLKDNDCVEICDNKYGADIITCKIAGHNVIGVHGDNDQPRTALERLSLMTHEHYDMLCTAHFHHFSCDENHQTIIVSNSSLMGVDRYAEKLRLTSDPSQTFVVATPENVCECIYRILLK